MFFFVCVIYLLFFFMVWIVFFMFYGSVLVFFVDLEWRLNVINSDFFDNFVGYKNLR